MILILTRSDLRKKYQKVAAAEVRQWMFKNEAFATSTICAQTYFFSAPDEAGILLIERTTDSMMDEIRTKLRVPSLFNNDRPALANLIPTFTLNLSASARLSKTPTGK